MTPHSPHLSEKINVWSDFIIVQFFYFFLLENQKWTDVETWIQWRQILSQYEQQRNKSFCCHVIDYLHFFFNQRRKIPTFSYRYFILGFIYNSSIKFTSSSSIKEYGFLFVFLKQGIKNKKINTSLPLPKNFFFLEELC